MAPLPTRRLWIALLVACVAGIALVWWLRRGSDEDQIRAQLTRLAGALHTGEEGANSLLHARARARAPRMRSDFEAIFDETVHVSVPELPTALPTKRSELADSATQLTGYYASLEVTLTDVEIKLDDAKTSAHVAATAKLTAGGARARSDTRAVNFLFYKREGAWRITSVTVWAKDDASP